MIPKSDPPPLLAQDTETPSHWRDSYIHLEEQLDTPITVTLPRQLISPSNAKVMMKIGLPQIIEIDGRSATNVEQFKSSRKHGRLITGSLRKHVSKLSKSPV